MDMIPSISRFTVSYSPQFVAVAGPLVRMGKRESTRFLNLDRVKNRRGESRAYEKTAATPYASGKSWGMYVSVPHMISCIGNANF